MGVVVDITMKNETKTRKIVCYRESKGKKGWNYPDPGLTPTESCTIITLSLWPVEPVEPSGATSNEFSVQYPALIEI